MKKKFGFLAVALLVFAMTVPAAAETTRTNAGTVTFTGSRMNSSFSSSKLAASVSEMQPGDAVTFEVKLSNAADFTTDWYMSNEVLSSLEDAQDVAENGGYSYKLSYMDADGSETVLYNSDSIGGDKDQSAGAGLNEATDSLGDFFYLDRLENGESGTVTLSISLDGESQGNIYQDTLATLKMNFAAEKASGSSTPGQPGSSVHLTNQVQTGDIWTGGALIALIAGIIFLIIGIIAIKKKEADAA